MKLGGHSEGKAGGGCGSGRVAGRVTLCSGGWKAGEGSGGNVLSGMRKSPGRMQGFRNIPSLHCKGGGGGAGQFKVALGGGESVGKPPSVVYELPGEGGKAPP